MRYTTSPRGLALIQHFESFSATVYTCPAGKLTIGYGHVVRKTDRITPPITREQADALLRNDLAPVEIYLAGVLPSLKQNEIDALASFAFNVGLGAFEKSTLLQKIKAGDKPGAAAEFGRWVHAGDEVQPGLVTRRRAERDMFMESA